MPRTAEAGTVGGHSETNGVSGAVAVPERRAALALRPVFAEDPVVGAADVQLARGLRASNQLLWVRDDAVPDLGERQARHTRGGKAAKTGLRQTAGLCAQHVQDR